MTSSNQIMAIKPSLSFYQNQNIEDMPIIKNIGKKNIRAVIFEINLIAAKSLIRQINEINPDIIVEKTFTDLTALVEYYHIVEKQPDLLFTEVNVGLENCFDLFKYVEVKSKIVFTTADRAFAVDAFRVDAVDYLIKPVQLDQLECAIEKALAINLNNGKKENLYKTRLLVKWANKLHTVNCTEIAYIVSKNKISYIYNFKGERIPSVLKLQAFEDMLDPSIFFRASRQFIVNYESIAEIKTLASSRMEIRLSQSKHEAITLSVDRAKSFKLWINR